MNANHVSLFPIQCPLCKTANGMVRVNPSLLLTLFVEVICSNCRQRCVTASDTSISAGPNAHALQLKEAQEKIRSVTAANARLEAELNAARERIEEMERYTPMLG